MPGGILGASVWVRVAGLRREGRAKRAGCPRSCMHLLLLLSLSWSIRKTKGTRSILGRRKGPSGETAQQCNKHTKAPPAYILKKGLLRNKCLSRTSLYLALGFSIFLLSTGMRSAGESEAWHTGQERLSPPPCLQDICKSKEGKVSCSTQDELWIQVLLNS